MLTPPKHIIEIKNPKKGRRLKFFDTALSSMSNNKSKFQRSTQRLQSNPKRPLSTRQNNSSSYTNNSCEIKIEKLNFYNPTIEQFLPPKSSKNSSNRLFTNRNNMQYNTSAGFMYQRQRNSYLSATGFNSKKINMQMYVNTNNFFQHQQGNAKNYQNYQNYQNYRYNNNSKSYINAFSNNRSKNNPKFQINRQSDQSNNQKQQEQNYQYQYQQEYYEQQEYLDGRYLKAKIEASALEKFKELYKKQTNIKNKKIQENQAKMLICLLDKTSRSRKAKDNNISTSRGMTNDHIKNNNNNINKKLPRDQTQKASKKLFFNNSKQSNININDVTSTIDKINTHHNSNLSVQELRARTEVKQRVYEGVKLKQNLTKNQNYVIQSKKDINNAYNRKETSFDNIIVQKGKEIGQAKREEHVTCNTIINKNNLRNSQIQSHEKSNDISLKMKTIQNQQKVTIQNNNIKHQNTQQMKKIVLKQQITQKQQNKINQIQSNNNNFYVNKQEEQIKQQKDMQLSRIKKNSFQASFNIIIPNVPVLKTVQRQPCPIDITLSNSKNNNRYSKNPTQNNEKSRSVDQKKSGIIIKSSKDHNRQQIHGQQDINKQLMGITSKNNINKKKNVHFNINNDDDQLEEVVLQQMGRLPIYSISHSSTKNINSNSNQKIIEINNNKSTTNQQQQQQKSITPQSSQSITSLPQNIKSLQAVSDRSNLVPISEMSSSNIKQKQKKQQANQKFDQAQQQFNEDEQENTPVEELFYYIGIVQTLGGYNTNSKQFYSSVNSSMVQIVMNHRLAAYYISNQFYFYENMLLKCFSNPNPPKFYTLQQSELKQAIADEQTQESIIQLKKSYQMTPKLIKHTYEKCKIYLKKSQKQLLICSQIDYHSQCVKYLKEEFRQLHNIYVKGNRVLKNIQERLCFIIEMFNILMTLKGQEFKEFEQLEDIGQHNYMQHLDMYARAIMKSEGNTDRVQKEI